MRTQSSIAIIASIAIGATLALELVLAAPATAAPAPGRTTGERSPAPDRTTGERGAPPGRITGERGAPPGRTTGERGGGAGAGPDDTGAASDDLELAGSVVPAGGPKIGAVLSAAYTAAGLDGDPGHSWSLRARLGGLVPWVTVRTTRDTSWQDTQPEVGHGTTFEVRATWRLDRLVFDGRELQVAAIEAARRRERRRLATRVIRSYFTWRRAAESALDPGDERAATRVAEATAELDALTDGWFSDELSRARRGTEPKARRGAAP